MKTVTIDARIALAESAHAPRILDAGTGAGGALPHLLALARRGGGSVAAVDAGLVRSSDVVWPATFEDPAQVVRALAEALAPGGVLALFTTDHYPSMFLPGHSRLERLVRTASELTWGLPGDGPTHDERPGAWMREAGLARAEALLDPDGAEWIGSDPDAYVVQPAILWTGRAATA